MEIARFVIAVSVALKHTALKYKLYFTFKAMKRIIRNINK